MFHRLRGSGGRTDLHSAATFRWPGPETHQSLQCPSDFQPKETCGEAGLLHGTSRRCMIVLSIRRGRGCPSFTCLYSSTSATRYPPSLINSTIKQKHSSIATMKFFAPTLPLIAVLAAFSNFAAAGPTPDGNIVARDVCPPGYPSYCRSTGSPCAASNGVHEFCSCDRTNIVSGQLS